MISLFELVYGLLKNFFTLHESQIVREFFKISNPMIAQQNDETEAEEADHSKVFHFKDSLPVVAPLKYFGSKKLYLPVIANYSQKMIYKKRSFCYQEALIGANFPPNENSIRGSGPERRSLPLILSVLSSL